MVWGTDYWGSGSRDEVQDVVKVLAESLTMSMVNANDFIYVLGNSISLDMGPSSEELSDSTGYDYVFPNDVTNLENRAVTTYSSMSASSQSFTSVARGSTVWS